jgi:hypothetical protein|tara:strand:- start:619 stop:846 length:228 start_codon:yes stop_codon:yes gene_type:complete
LAVSSRGIAKNQPKGLYARFPAVFNGFFGLSRASIRAAMVDMAITYHWSPAAMRALTVDDFIAFHTAAVERSANG